MKSFEESFENLASEWAKPARPHDDARIVTTRTTPHAGESAKAKAGPAPETRDASVPSRGTTRSRSETVSERDAAPEPVSEPGREHPDEPKRGSQGAANPTGRVDSRSAYPDLADRGSEERGSPDDPGDQGRVDPHLVCLLDPRSEHAESYYRLRYALESRRPADSALVVGITSPSQGDGKTLTGINLAGALAKDAGTQVLLLDLDLRRQGNGMPDYLGMNTERNLGIVDWIRETGYGDEQFTHYLHRFNLHVMAAGSDPELPYELLKSSRLDDLIRSARRRYDFVIIDTPQILRLPDTELIARLVDGFLIVVKADQTRHGELEEALNLMTEDKVLGLVFNAVDEHR